jgi:hypothetical protein
MQVFVFNHKLFAFLHVVTREKVVELLLQNRENVFQSLLDLLCPLGICLFNLLLDLKYIHHKFAVLHLYSLLYINSPQLHEVGYAVHVVQQRSFSVVYVCRVFDHFIMESDVAVFGKSVWMELLLKILRHIFDGLDVDAVLFGSAW